jgi:hypothetical protein
MLKVTTCLSSARSRLDGNQTAVLPQSRGPVLLVAVKIQKLVDSTFLVMMTMMMMETAQEAGMMKGFIWKRKLTQHNGSTYQVCQAFHAECVVRLIPVTVVFVNYGKWKDCFCGLVVKVPGYISRGPGFNSQHYKIF